MRVNTYTDVHAVAEMADARCDEATKFVKASGGCSAPMGMSDEEAMKGMGDMRLKVAGDVAANKPVDATLMIRHPNFNGMQMNQVTRDYTPARYIQNIAVTYDDKQVFKLDTDISLASNPVISFDFIPSAAKGDSEGRCEGQPERPVVEELQRPERQQLRWRCGSMRLGWPRACCSLQPPPRRRRRR